MILSKTLVGMSWEIALVCFGLCWGCGSSGPCPDGAKLTGAKPPDGSKAWCAKEDKGGNIVKHGRFTRWHENGKKAQEGQYRNNEKDGLWTEWTKEGMKITEGKFREGKKQGTWTAWGNNGQKSAELVYADGKQHGRSVMWHPSGKKGVESNYKEGLQTGMTTTWNKNGQKSGEGNYIGGEKQGTWTNWDESGKKIGEVVYDGAGRSTTKAFDDAGKVRAIMEKSGDMVLRSTLLDEKGHPEEVKEFQNGQLAKVTRYADGVETGSEVFMAGRWSVAFTTSSMDDSPEVYISADALAPVKPRMNEEFLPKLVLRCTKGKTEAVVQTGGPSEAEVHDHNYRTDRRTVVLRFDDAKAAKMLATQSTSMEALFLPRPVSQIKKMLKADSLLFQHTVMRGGSQTISFDLRQLNKVIPRLQKACGWGG